MLTMHQNSALEMTQISTTTATMCSPTTTTTTTTAQIVINNNEFDLPIQKSNTATIINKATTTNLATDECDDVAVTALSMNAAYKALIAANYAFNNINNNTNNHNYNGCSGGSGVSVNENSVMLRFRATDDETRNSSNQHQHLNGDSGGEGVNYDTAGSNLSKIQTQQHGTHAAVGEVESLNVEPRQLQKGALIEVKQELREKALQKAHQQQQQQQLKEYLDTGN